MKRETIRDIVKIVQENGGEYSINYIPESTLTEEECYNLYYGGASKLTIFKDGYMVNHKLKKIDNVELIVDDIYHLLKDDISLHLHQAMSNLRWEYEELKYFDSYPHQFKKFLKEIDKLKNQ